MGRDASIILQQVKFSYNGTFVCQVKNPPDVHGLSGEIRLHVVTTGLPPHSKQNIAPVVGNHNAYTLLKCCCLPVSPSYLQPRSPIFSCWRWLSEGASPPWCCSSSSLCPAGGARRGEKGREKDARRLPAKREKTLQCGKSERRGKGGGSVGEEWHTSSLTPILTLGMRAGVRPSRGRGVDFFPAGYTTSTSFHNCTLWI